MIAEISEAFSSSKLWERMRDIDVNSSVMFYICAKLLEQFQIIGTRKIEYISIVALKTWEIF